jgi:LacI family transcriptional regulator
MSHSRVTQADIAREAGVSVAVVSLVLSGKAEGRASRATIDAVEAAARRLGYHPNLIARGLRTKESRTIGLLSVQVATTPYAGDLLGAVQMVCRENGFNLVFMEVSNTPEEIEAGLRILSQQMAQGVILATYYHQPVELPENVPQYFVLADCFATNGRVTAFVPGEKESFRQVLNEVHQYGHKDIAFVLHDVDLPATRARRQAFLEAAQDFGWTNPTERIVLVDDSNSPDGFLAVDRIFAAVPDVTAIICYTDRLAMGVYSGLNLRGLRVPHDISVVGFDDQKLISEGISPGLTTVRLPHMEMGQRAATHLIGLIDGSIEDNHETVEIVGPLVQRGSVSRPALAKAETRGEQLAP